MAQLLMHAMRWWVRATPERVALDMEGDSVSYAELDGWSDAVAALMRDRHRVRPGDIVVIHGANSIEWCVAAVAVMKIAAIIAPANIFYPRDELEFFIDNTAPRLVLLDEADAQKLRLLPVGEPLNLVTLGSLRALRGQAHASIPAEVAPSAPAMILFTSGTTGRPRGIVYTNQTILAVVFELLLMDPTPPAETNALLMLPMFTSAGVYLALGSMIARGGKLVLMPRFEPRRALQLLAQQRISHVSGTPVMWERMAIEPDFASYDLSCLKVANCGGARLADDAMAAFKRRGVVIRQAYGLTESGGPVTIARHEQALRDPGTVGDGGLFAEIKVVRSDGAECRAHEPGEIFVRAPYIMSHYWNNAQKTAEAFVDGWLRSDDIGVRDEVGQLRFVDRISNYILCGNNRISPNEVERAISSIPGITEVAVVSVPDATLGQAAAAVVFSRTGKPSKSSVEDAVRRQLGDGQVPLHVVISADPLPRLASGKFDRKTLRLLHTNVARVPLG